MKFSQHDARQNTKLKGEVQKCTRDKGEPCKSEEEGSACLWAHALRTNIKLDDPPAAFAACVDQLRPLPLPRKRHKWGSTTPAALAPAPDIFFIIWHASYAISQKGL